MSNVSEVTPYDTSNSSNESATAQAGIPVAAAVGALAVGCAAAVRWLVQESEADRAALAHSRARRAEVAVNCGGNRPPQSLRTAHLHLRSPDTLVQTALGLGYWVETAPLADSAGQATLLRSPTGQRLALAPNAQGRLTLLAAGAGAGLGELLRQHSLDRALAHLTRQGMEVRTARLGTGEVQIVARETTPKTGGAAEVKAQIRKDGSAWVDVDRIQGRRCEAIVAGLAEAMGGQASQVKKKDAWFQLPGEPAKTHVKI